MKPEVSIIICLFDFAQVLRNMTKACISDIRRFTPEGRYELIVIDNEPKIPWRDEFGVYRLEDETFIVNDKDRGYYGSLNQGAALARGKYLCFMQPDVYVHEGWFDGLLYHLKNNKLDVVFPDQFPSHREAILESYKAAPEANLGLGGRESGMVMMTKKIFNKANGWDDRLKNEYGEAAMWNRLDRVGAKWEPTRNALITHIGAGTRYTMDYENPSQHNADMEHDGKLWEKIRDEV